MKSKRTEPVTHGTVVQQHPIVLLSAKVTALCAGLIALAAALAYSNSFTVPFLFDDQYAIVDNPNLRSLWPIWEAMSSPAEVATAGRPTFSLSFAINYAISGTQVWSYHAGNLLIHMVSALALFGIARRTFLSDRLRERFGSAATGLGLAVALLWAVHPLHSMSVTYVISRGESMMGMFYFLTLYCSIRSYGSARPLGWYVAAVAACVLGMGSKEVMATAPLMVLMYDAVFVTRTWGGALRRRWGFYTALGATWIVLAILVASGPRNKTVGFHFEDVGPMDYARTMCAVILNYYKLSFWPSPLVFDHHIPWVRTYRECFWEGLAVVSLLLVTAWALWKKPAVGYASAWFFVILGPSTSFLPIVTENACEYRMYLPLAGIAGLTVAAVYMASAWAASRGVVSATAMRRTLICATAAATAVLAFMTWQRNKDYQSELAIWQDTVLKEPDNSRAWQNYGVALEKQGRLPEAVEAFRQAVKQLPEDVAHKSRSYVHYLNLGFVLYKVGEYAESLENHSKSIELLKQREATVIRHSSGEVLIDLGKEYADSYSGMGWSLHKLGRDDEALHAFREALRIKPDHAEAYYTIGVILGLQGNLSGAIEAYRHAVRIKPDYPDAYDNLGIMLHLSGRTEDSIVEFRRALEVQRERSGTLHNLGLALQSLGQLAEAEKCYREALQYRPDYPEANCNLASALQAQGRLAEAVQYYREALRLRPNYPKARDNLAVVLKILENAPSPVMRPPQ